MSLKSKESHFLWNKMNQTIYSWRGVAPGLWTMKWTCWGVPRGSDRVSSPTPTFDERVARWKRVHFLQSGKMRQKTWASWPQFRPDQYFIWRLTFLLHDTRPSAVIIIIMHLYSAFYIKWSKTLWADAEADCAVKMSWRNSAKQVCFESRAEFRLYVKNQSRFWVEEYAVRQRIRL